MPQTLPLAGCIIIEHVRAGGSEVTLRAIALAGRIAADLGAQVFRIIPAGEDPLAGDAAANSFLNDGKGLLPAGLDGSDLSIDAILTDAPDELPAGTGRAEITVIVAHGVPADCRIPDARVTDTTILALSGLLDLIGDPDAAPVPFGGHQASYVAGLAAFSGLMAALAGGKPDIVRVSALEACLWSNWKSYAERLYLGRGPTRQGHRAEWQAIPCSDGFATFIYLEKDWPAICRMLGEPRLAQPPFDTQAGRRANVGALYGIVRPWYAQRSRADVYVRARAEGLPIAPVLSVREVIADPQYAAQRFFAPVAPLNADATAATPCVPTIPTVWNGRRFPPSHSPNRSPEKVASSKPRSPAARPLDGCRVLDLGIITAGASTSALLADLGADVIKLEGTAYIDPFRVWDRGLGAPDWWNRSRFFGFTNRNKRGLALDLKRPEGKALFLDLVANSDVLVENFRRGVLDRLGLGFDVLQVANPRLVMCSITSQGESGPDATAASYGSTLEANSGLADLTRDASGQPLISGILVNYPDQIVSIYAAGIIALAVAEQRRSGTGARLDISQRELASFLIGEHILAASSGAHLRPRWTPPLVRSGDGRWLLCHGADAQAIAAGLAKCVPANLSSRPAVALMADLAAHDIQAVVVRNADDILAAVLRGETGNAFARGPEGGEAKGMPFALDSMPFHFARRAPDLGQHNAEVLSGVLGISAAEIAELAARGVIGTEPTT